MELSPHGLTAYPKNTVFGV